MNARIIAALFGILLAASQATAQIPAKIDFNRDVRPILSDKCFACHGPDEKVRKGDLRLDTRAGAIANAVVPGKPEASTLIERITTKEPEELMPPAKTGKKLTAREVEILTQWVKESAPYAVHWAYAKPVRPPVPKSTSWAKNPIDAFVLARLEKEKLAPAPEADKFSLIRRAAHPESRRIGPGP